MSEELKTERLFKNKSLGLQITKERLEFFNERENKSYSFLIKDLKTKEGTAMGTRVCFYFGKNQLI